MVEQLTQHDPRRIGPFEVLGRLGSGGMGLVYLARSASGRRVAIKTVRTELAEDQLFRVRFTREVEAARAVSGFYTAAVVDADPRAAIPWLATAYVPSPSLEEIVTECGPLPVQAVRWLAAGVAEALQSIHGAGLVHRDLKPSNVLVVEDGPRVIDFGIASGVSNTRLTMTNVAVGTPAYMSPEQARDSRSVTGASDVFSLASTLVFAATGHAPFHGANPVETVFMLLREGPDLEGLPDELHGLIESCMRMNPEERPTPADLQAQLAPHLFGAGSDDSGTVSAWLPSTAVSLIECRRGGRSLRRREAAGSGDGAAAAGNEPAAVGAGSAPGGSPSAPVGPGGPPAVGARAAGGSAGPGAQAPGPQAGAPAWAQAAGPGAAASGSGASGSGAAAGNGAASGNAAAFTPGPAAQGAASAGPGAARHGSGAGGGADWDQGIPPGPRAGGAQAGPSGAGSAEAGPSGAGRDGTGRDGAGAAPVVSRPPAQPPGAEAGPVQLPGAQVPIGPGPRRPDETGRDTGTNPSTGWVRPPEGSPDGAPPASYAQPYPHLPPQAGPTPPPGPAPSQAAPAVPPAPPSVPPYAPGPRHAGAAEHGAGQPPGAHPLQQPPSVPPAPVSAPSPQSAGAPAPPPGPAPSARPTGGGQTGGAQRWRPWRFRMSNDVWGSPVVADDLVYVTSFEVHALDVASGRRQFKTREVAWSMAVSGGRVHASDGPSLYALDAADGSERWRLATDGWVYSLQVDRGTVVTGTRGGGVQAWEAASGEKLWDLTGAQADFETPEGGPVIADGAVYTWADGRLYVFEARTGTERWSYPVGDAAATGGVPVRVTAAEDGSVYVCAGSRVFALDAATGRERWRFDAPAAFLSPPAFVPGPGVTGGGVYLADYLGTVYALDSGNGNDRWRIATEARHSTEPVVTADGLVHLGSGGAVYTLDAVSGTPRWRFATGADVVGAPVVADGRVHFGSADHCLYTVDAVGGQLRWKLATGGEITGSPVVVAGVVYACSKDRCVYALDATKGTGQSRQAG
ncbi:PQQ-binding-like beta-propeller repeat protein [Streptomyces albus]|uniref:outer membrane protein assembly factor BamB family protein n=1 Tax=Streptomyces albus TaxID=1888 RepID=UPI0024AE4A24|nr:PQQ-binding-like beta-propeller repeat protein [Streptomyces albus]MDI6410564.1 PQQ-binding-like beta-propeller repeat protein [Streptomyces albus]